MVLLLIILHAVATFDAKYIPAGRHTGPIKMPIIFSTDRRPIALLKVINQHRFVHICAIRNSYAVLLAGGNDSEESANFTLNSYR